jgi:biotin carboxyl carrier protein
MATEVKTTVPGNVWKVLVKVGDIVKKNDDLFIMEVMKTEVHHSSPVDGKVIKVNVVNDQEGIDPGIVAILI